MPEDFSPSMENEYEKYLKSGDIAYKALTQGLLNDKYIELYKQQHPEDIGRIEAFLHPEKSAESVEKELNEKIKKIETYSEKIMDIPDNQEKRINDLGGDTDIIEEQLKPEFNFLKTIRENTKHKFVKFAAMLGWVGSGFLNSEKPQMSDKDVLAQELYELKNRDFVKSENRILSNSLDNQPFTEDESIKAIKGQLNDLILMKKDPDRYIKEVVERNIRGMLEIGQKPNPDLIREYFIKDMKSYTPETLDERIELVRSWIPTTYQEVYEIGDKQLAWMNKILKSSEYKKRALEYESLSQDDIANRLNRINKYDYNIEDDVEYDKNHPLSAGVYDDKKVFLRKSNLNGKEPIPVHEFTHQSTDGNDHMSEYAKKLYDKAFTDQNLTLDEKEYSKKIGFNDSSGYWRDFTELDARKKELEYFMEQLGIKKYEEKFTQEHYNKLLKLQKQKKLPEQINKFIRFIKPEYIEQIMNTIADNSNEQDTQSSFREDFAQSVQDGTIDKKTASYFEQVQPETAKVIRESLKKNEA